MQVRSAWFAIPNYLQLTPVESPHFPTQAKQHSRSNKKIKILTLVAETGQVRRRLSTVYPTHHGEHEVLDLIPEREPHIRRTHARTCRGCRGPWWRGVPARGRTRRRSRRRRRRTRTPPPSSASPRPPPPPPPRRPGPSLRACAGACTGAGVYLRAPVVGRHAAADAWVRGRMSAGRWWKRAPAKERDRTRSRGVEDTSRRFALRPL